MSVLQYPWRLGPERSSTSRMTYTVNSCFPSRKPRPGSMKGHKTLKRDIKETMQHATLINIVAAVNEDTHGRSFPRQGSGSTTKTIRSTLSVVTDFMFPHEKSVSIPQSKQKIFSMPGEIAHRKPVYYKHSGDLEVRTQPYISLFTESDSQNFKVKKDDNVLKPKPSARDIIQSLPKKPQIINFNFPTSNRKLDDKLNTSKEHLKRASSGVRQLGAVKKTERRQIRQLPKCNAVDLLESQAEKDIRKSVSNDSSNVTPAPTSSKIPYIRTKSLPIIFPTKMSKRVSPSLTGHQRQPTLYRDRPLSQSLRNKTPESMYKRINHLPGGFGFGELSINNGINQTPDISGRLVHDSEKHQNTRASLGGSSKQRDRFCRNIRSPASPSIGRGSPGVFLTLQDVLPDFQPRNSRMKTYNCRNALHEAVRRAMSGRMKVHDSAMSKTENRSVTSARSKKSCLTSRSGLSDNLSEVRANKRVQFLSGSSVSSSETVSEKEAQNSPNPVYGGSGIIETHTPATNLRAFSPGIQPMSVRELLRLEQKILPANTPPPPPDILANYYRTNALINVQRLQRSSSDMSSKMNVRSEDIDQNVNEPENKDESAAQNGDNTTDKAETKSRNEDLKEDASVSDSFEHNDEVIAEDDNSNDGDNININSNDSEGSDDNDDSGETGFYKLVKAVDKQPYEGFEHKKIRRSSIGSKSKDQEKEQQKAHYVKVRLS